MSTQLDPMSWPIRQGAEALEALARRCRLTLSPDRSASGSRTRETPDGATLERTLEAVAHWLRIELEPIGARYAELRTFLRRSGPALLVVPGPGETRLLALVTSSRNRVT